jgi:hypothetical protein
MGEIGDILSFHVEYDELLIDALRKLLNSLESK